MGNCGACLFFTVIDPIARSGKGTAHARTYTVNQTKRAIYDAIKSGKKMNVKPAWVELSLDSYPEDVVNEAIQLMEKKGYRFHTSKSERSIRIEIN